MPFSFFSFFPSMIYYYYYLFLPFLLLPFLHKLAAEFELKNTFNNFSALFNANSIDPGQKSSLQMANAPSTFNQTEWSTYRPQLYFGLKSRRPDSPMFGLMWYEQEEGGADQLPSIRHWALHEDNVLFSWNRHDGRHFGSQDIQDGQLQIRTNWLNYGSASWMARLFVSRKEWAANGHAAIIVYLALQDQPGIFNTISAGKNAQIRVIGKSEPFGGKMFALQTEIVQPQSAPWLNTSSSTMCHRAKPFVDMAKVDGLVKTRLELQPDGKYAFGLAPCEESNFFAAQIILKENTIVEISFQMENDSPAPEFDVGIRLREEAFREKFDRAFPIPQKFPAIYHRMGHAALSNLLGGIGVWHGSLWMRSRKFPRDSLKRYGPFSLLSAVPSRTGFPRGFLWDEGFHNLLIHKFDPALSLEIVAAYLDMMNIDGWIPREIVLGSESEARMPGTFLVQEDWVANPPMFFYFLREFMADSKRTEEFAAQLVRIYPRMKQLYLWLRESQRGPLPGTFQWHDRNGTTDRELNPGAMSSGLDDYPRATHPTKEEYHLDLLCWMAMSSEVLAKLAELAEDGQFLVEIRKEAALLNDAERLDALHWSEKVQQYCDYGLHSDSVKLVKEESPEGGEISFVRKVLKKPEYGFVEDVNGVGNLFPLFLRLLPANSSKIGPLLRQMADPKQLWTPFGLRSISTLSPYYMEWNSKWSSPYWRGPVWINMNYFALGALKHYASLDGPHKEECANLHDRLRANIVENMAKEYERTGFIWEHYNDVSGLGEGNHPFTGWSTLILAILSGNY